VQCKCKAGLIKPRVGPDARRPHGRGVRTGMALRHAVRARRLTGPASEAPPARAHTPHHLESSIDGLGVGRLAEESGRSRRRRRTGGLAGTADRRRARAREAEVPRGPGGRGHAHVRPSMDHNLPGMGYCQLPLPASAGVSRGPHGARGPSFLFFCPFFFLKDSLK
jgi:hypothetical protein